MPDLRSTFERIRSRCEKSRGGDTKFEACCPSHTDRAPSFGARLTHDRILLSCQAGCTVPDICAALGIEERDLFAERRAPRPAGDIRTTIVWHGPDGHRDQLRIDHADGTKTIRWADRGGIGSRRLLYSPSGWPLPLGGPVLIAEGAKAADAIHRATGLPVIGIPNAAAVTDPDVWRWAAIAGRHITLWPDHDEPGYRIMATVALSLQRRIHWIDPTRLPGASRPLPPHFDAADYGPWPEPPTEALRAALCEQQPPFETPTPGDAPDGASDGNLDLDKVMPLLRDCSTEIVPTSWLWRDRIPAGAPWTLTGAPDAGKSLVGISVVAHLSSGTSLPGDPPDPEPLRCAWIGAEDEDAHQTIVSRLIAAGASGDHVRIYRAGADPHAVGPLCRLAAQWEPHLTMLDSHVAWFSESVDAQAVRAEIKAAVRTLIDCGSAVGIISHWRKSKVEDGPQHDRTAGAAAGLIGGMRAALEVRKDGAAGIVRCTKHNLGPQPLDVEFSFDAVDGIGVVRWGECAEPTTDDSKRITVDALLATLDTEHPVGWTKSQIAKALDCASGGGQRMLSAAIEQAFDQGLIVAYQVRINKRHWTAYRRSN